MEALKSRRQRTELLLARGEVQTAVRELNAFAATLAEDPLSLQQTGEFFTRLNLHLEAERCYARAAQIEPLNAASQYNWATSLIAIGRFADAEAVLTKVIALAPADCDAYYNRSTLRKQTSDHNHVAELEAALVRPRLRPAEAVPLCYALAKELEDLGEYARSFAALKRGADIRRALLRYRVGDDLAAMAQLAQTFDAGFFSTAPQGFDDARPIFIMGLPRSGTTVVDRILSSHSKVCSRGETADFALSLIQLAGPAAGKQQLIARSSAVDFAALGAQYGSRVSASAEERLIDKTPINFLYLGLIATALPRARIVHVRRNPVDVCFAMYKTLFRMAYPFSYDLRDIAYYYLGYQRLMAHWRTVLPGAFLEVDYEDLVSNQEAVSRRLVEHCGLEWEESCLTFERNPDPCLTASAAQVRQPMYATSVGLWRRYEEALQPLIEVLRAGGVQVEGG